MEAVCCVTGNDWPPPLRMKQHEPLERIDGLVSCFLRVSSECAGAGPLVGSRDPRQSAPFGGSCPWGYPVCQRAFPTLELGIGLTKATGSLPQRHEVFEGRIRLEIKILSSVLPTPSHYAVGRSQEGILLISCPR